MTADTPTACALDRESLERRLTTIAEVGADSLLCHETNDDRHLLRFRSGAATRRRLEEIVAAEARCCPFLTLTLSEEDGQLLLSITAPREAQALAINLAAAFATTEGAAAPATKPLGGADGS